MNLAALYDEWGSRLLAYMITITRDRHRAEDALQNLFVHLATARPDMKNPAVYLYRAARNEAVRVSRRRSERPLAGLDILHMENPSEAADVAAAIDRLPKEQSEVVILHCFEGLPFREIGEILGVRQDTAASRYRYALEKLSAFFHE